MQPILAVTITSGSTLAILASLRSRNLPGELRLEQIVGAGRAAAEMTLGNLEDVEAGLLQQRERQGVELLAVLERAGGVIGDAQAGPHHRRDKPDRRR